MTALNKYKAYTLMEMLIVMSIFIIIGAIGFSSFYGMRDSISMNEEVLTLQQDIRYAQRAALFLERSSTDRWLYGIGIDFSDAPTTGEYKMFKWCSQFSDYGDVRTKAVVPNFDKTLPLSQLNGNLPLNTYVNANCSTGLNISELVQLKKFGTQSLNAEFSPTFLASNDAIGDVGSIPQYVLFESVSGRAFFYDSNGKLINYDGTGIIVSNPVDFVLSIQSKRTKVKKTITITNISGKVNVTKENL